MEYYWKLTKKDGTTLEVEPAKVATIRKMWDDGIIRTTAGDWPASEIKSFAPTEKIYNDKLLLEEAARAFNEPVYDGEDIVARWVKKHVPKDRWERYYSNFHSYRKLADEGSSIVIAFAMPVHQIDANIISYCTREEIAKLTTQNT